MHKFNNLLICLDLTEMDYFLISYTNFIVRILKPDKLTFIHVMETYDIPDEIMESFQDTDKDLNEIIREELEERIEKGLSVKDDVDYNLVLEEGLTTEKIIHYAGKNKIDLSIMGKKIGYSGKGSVARKIVGLIPSSVLVVSETSQQRFEKLLVRMDFTVMARTTLFMAQTISRLTGASVECHHVYKLPLNYFPRQTPENIKKLKVQVGKIVKKEYEKFIRNIKIEDAPPCTYSLEIQSDESQLLYNHAIKNQIDLILTGTKIKSSLANLILDSTSEKLVGGDKSIPVMVVKDHKKSVGFLKAIFE